MQVLFLVVRRRSLQDQVRQLPARALIVADFQAPRVDDGQRMARLGEFLGRLGYGLARAGPGQFAAEHGIDERALADACLAGYQYVDAAGAAGCGADGVRDGVLQGGVVGAECAHLVAVECNGGCGNDIRTSRIAAASRALCAFRGIEAEFFGAKRN
ncbi:hypothetical protein D3C72_1822370 [compost metagenome]